MTALRVGLLLGMFLSAAPLAAEPISLADFLAREPQFGQLVGATFHIEGRPSTLTRDEVRLRGSDFRFLLQEPLERPRGSHVQIVGRLQQDAKGYHLAVSSLTAYKSEAELIRERIRQGDASDPQLYYTQAEWAEERAKFYSDETLHAEARRLRQEGVQAAQRKLGPDDSAALVALADRAAQWGLDARFRMELLHAATRADLFAESRNRMPAYAAVLNKVRSRFPGAEQPLPELPQDMLDSYQRRPQEVYAAADDEMRRLIHRMLFIETALRMIEADAKPDGSNGAAIASTVEKLVPERPDLPAKYRAAEFDYLESQIPRLDRAQVLELRNKLRQAGQPERAIAAVRKWIDLQLVQRPKGPATDVDRAELEFEMTQDAERALALASSALSVDPAAPGAKELLALMGYGWHRGRAVRTELIPAAPLDPFAAAIQQGRILAGMSDSQVRAALGGEPDAIVRMASQGRVTELWHYSAQRLTLHLDATRQKPQLEVQRIVELKARPQ